MPASMLECLAKARHPSPEAAAKAAGQAPAKQKESKKRSCSLRKPACALTKVGENASVRGGASILASLRSAPTKKQRAPEEPRALPLRAISTCQRRSAAAEAQSPARCGRLKPTMLQCTPAPASKGGGSRSTPRRKEGSSAKGKSGPKYLRSPLGASKSKPCWLPCQASLTHPPPHRSPHLHLPGKPEPCGYARVC